MKSKLMLTAALAIIGWTAAAIPAPADLSLDVAPAKYEVKVTPGTLQTIPITVRNSSDQPLHIQATLADFKVEPNGSYLFMKPGTGAYSIMKSADVNPREFDIAPNTAQMVRFSFTAPASMKGEYAGIVFFTTRPQRHAGRGIAFAERIASKIYAYDPNTLRIAGAVDRVSVKQTAIGEEFAVGFKNTGDAHIYLNGRIDVKRGDATVASVPLPAQQLVDRGGVRTLNVFGPKLPPGKYSAIALVDYGGTDLAGGEITFAVH
jgi:P pilus assembly chaperone PapD